MYSRRCVVCILRPGSELLAWDSTVSTDSPLYNDSTHSVSRDSSNFLAQTARCLHSFYIAWKHITPRLPVCTRMHDMVGCSHCPVDPFSHTIHRNFVWSVVVCLGCDESPWFRSVVQGLPSFPFACLVWCGTCGCVFVLGLGRTFPCFPCFVRFRIGFHSVSTPIWFVFLGRPPFLPIQEEEEGWGRVESPNQAIPSEQADVRGVFVSPPVRSHTRTTSNDGCVQQQQTTAQSQRGHRGEGWKHE